MCSAAGSCGGAFASRSARSLVRTESSEASDTFCGREAGASNRVAQTASKMGVNFSICLGRGAVFNNFITRYYFSGAAESGCDTAILLVRKFNGPGDRRLRNGMTGDDVLHVKLRKGARKLFTPVAVYFDAITGHLLPLLFQDRNHVHAGAATERQH